MTAAMFDEMTDREAAARQDPTQLRPGTLIYLWAPGEAKSDDRTLARVKMARRDVIEAVDLRSGGGEALYEVGTDLTNPNKMRWTWEIAAPPQHPQLACGVEIVDAIMSVAERTKLVAGEPGDNLRVSLTSGEMVHGVLKRLVMGQDNWEAEWAELEDHVPGRDIAVHVIRVAEIAKVTRFRRA